MVSAAVLAGGKAARMGTDKALIRLRGRTLLAATIAAVSTLTDDVLVVGRQQQAADFVSARFVPDVRPGAGALGGIYTALSAAQHPRCIVVGCDMPFLNPRLLFYLADLSADFDVVIPRVGGFLEPLHAVYASTCLPPIARLLEQGVLRILDFFPEVRVRYVDTEEMRRFGDVSLSLFNVNTPQQLEQALALAGRGGARIDD
ncbi:MAG: molybdenum cofactor guanylyltransferase [Chloroflexi bacterium]|nr:molybdenum cofactor guanylyltransferase [Chloroflexota bacterium]MCL5108202.1 molybdenum cofactor guanylyltransferase [Chloroflexota bacterium]